MLSQIIFQNYKAFSRREKLELKPITLLLGKNSSGKTSLLKMFSMLSGMLTGNLKEPLALQNGDIRTGSNYQDLFYGRSTSGLMFDLQFENGLQIQSEYVVNGDEIASISYKAVYEGQNLELSTPQECQQLRGLYHEVFQQWGLGASIQLPFQYIGPLRVAAPDSVTFKGYSDEENIGFQGENSYGLLLNSYKRDKKLLTEVSDWFHDSMDGHSLSFTNSANNSGIYSLMVEHRGVEMNIPWVGQGIAQVLPVVVMAYLARKGSLNMIEQPALHLHPGAHSSVAYLLGRQAKASGSTFLIESHSKNLLLGFCKLVVDSRVPFTSDDIAIYYVDTDEQGSFLRRYEIGSDGVLSDELPEGVFEESFHLLREINRMAL